MKKHFCDLCGVDITGERIHILDVHYYNDEVQRMPSIPTYELCPACKEWLRECISLKQESSAQRKKED